MPTTKLHQHSTGIIIMISSAGSVNVQYICIYVYGRRQEDRAMYAR